MMYIVIIFGRLINEMIESFCDESRILHIGEIGRMDSLNRLLRLLDG